MLPKICKTTMLEQKKKKTSHIFNNDSKTALPEKDEIENKKKITAVINDYLENFRNKQKGTILAVSTQK